MNLMKPALSPPHGTSLGTTAGITAVIVTVGAMALLGQCNGLTGTAAIMAAAAITFYFASAGCLYVGRNFTGMALDLAASDPAAGNLAAARGLTWFHAGMAALFSGCAFAAGFRLGLTQGGVAWVAPAIALIFGLAASSRSSAWAKETRLRAG